MKGSVLNRSHVTGKIIGAAIEVHKQLGPGLLESTYQQCLAYEFSRRGIAFEMEKSLPVQYKEVHLDCGYRLDFLVENEVIVELKAVKELSKLHKAQLMTYLKLSNLKLGLLLNFNVRLLKDGGITRISL